MRFNQEDELIRGIERKKHQEKVLEFKKPFEGFEKAHVMAERVLDEAAIKPQTFADLYDPASIQHHLKYVEERTREFYDKRTLIERERKNASTIFEAVMLERTELDNWFGKDVTSVKTSEYDDIANGVDMVLELSRPESSAHLALAVDVSYSPENTEKKISDIFQQVRGGKLSKVHYYESEKLHFRGELNNVPRIVLGLERDTAMLLGETWYRMHQGTLPKNSLTRSPVRGILIAQMYEQLRDFQQYARKINNQTAADAYGRSLTLVAEALTAAKADGMVIKHGQPKDRVHQAIFNGLARFSSTA